MSAESIRGASGAEYKLVGPLGEGGMGSAQLVLCEGDPRELVLKTLKLELAGDWKALELFEREVKVLQSLDHPGIPRFVDSAADRERGVAAFVQTRAPGTTLRERVARGQRMDHATLELALRQVLEIVAYLHGLNPPVVHRDITPGNVLWDGQRAYLIDFGSVKHTLRDSTVMTSVGTFGYMAPEQVLGKAEPASDLYGAGMTFVALAAGEEPERLAVDPATGQVDVAAATRWLPEHVRQTLIGLTRPGLSARLQSAEAALDALDAPQRALVTQREAAPAKKCASRQPISWRRKLRRGVISVAALCALVAGATWASALPMAPDEALRLGGWFTGHGDALASLPGDLLGDYHLISRPNRVEQLTWSHDGSRLYTSAHDALRIWSAESGAQLAQQPLTQRWYEPFTSLLALEDGALAGLETDGSVKIFDGATGVVKRTYGSPRSTVEALSTLWLGRGALALGADKRLLQLIGGTPRESGELARVFVIDQASSALVREVALGKGESEVTARLAAGKLFILSRDQDAMQRAMMLRVVSMETGEELMRVKRSSAEGRALAVSADGALVAVQIDGDVALFEVASRKQRWLVSTGRAWSWEQQPLAFSKDDKRLGAVDGESVLVLDVARGDILKRFERHRADVLSLAFSPDGKRLASGSKDQTVSVWRID